MDPPKIAKSAKNSTRGHFPFLLLLIVLYLILKTNRISKLNFYKKLNEKLSTGVISVFSTIILGFLFFVIVFGVERIVWMFDNFFNVFSEALAVNRWASTVAENKRVFIVDWFSNFGTVLFWAFIVGLIILIYQLTKKLKDGKK